MSNIRIGWCEKDISTDKAVNIPGQFHMRISTGVMDSLTTTALVLIDVDETAIFLSADCVVIRACLYDEVIAKVKAKNPAIPAERILMNATHTHEGASHYRDTTTFAAATQKDIEDSGIASSDEYRDFMGTQCADAVCEAWEKAQDGAVCWGYGYAVVGHSRRTTYLEDVSNGEKSGFAINGHAVMYGKTDDPRFAGYESGSDHFVNLLYTFDTKGNLTGAIVNVPCPSQNSEHEYQLSGDYWHNIRTEIRRRYGDHIFILGQCAAAGDLSPRILHYLKAQQRRMKLKYGVENYNGSNKALAERQDIAERVADAFGEVLSWARKDMRTEAVIKYQSRELQLSRRKITDDEYEYAKEALAERGEVVPKTDGTPRENLNVNSKAVSERNRFKGIIRRYESYESNPKMPMLAHVIRVGDIAFASNRFELYMDFMHRIQARSPFEQTFIVQLAGVPGEEGGSYLATTKGAMNKGYSASMYCNQVSPEGGQELVEGTLEMLNTLL